MRHQTFGFISYNCLLNSCSFVLEENSSAIRKILSSKNRHVRITFSYDARCSIKYMLCL